MALEDMVDGLRTDIRALTEALKASGSGKPGATVAALDTTAAAGEKRGPGRPKGSKEKAAVVETAKVEDDDLNEEDDAAGSGSDDEDDLDNIGGDEAEAATESAVTPEAARKLVNELKAAKGVDAARDVLKKCKVSGLSKLTPEQAPAVHAAAKAALAKK